MAVDGLYLDIKIRGYLMGPIVAFRDYIFTDVIPAFGNLDKRAEQVANDYYERVGSQPGSEYCDIDMADVADDAQGQSIDWYQMMMSLRQTMLNLLAAGLYHLVEQQLGALASDASFSEMPLQDTRMEVVRTWYLSYLHLDFATLPSWGTVDELRLVANAVKHAEGSATNQLRTRRPELFSNPNYAELYKELPSLGAHTKRVSTPLSGEDFFVSEPLLKEYAECAESLFNEIAAHFKASNDYY